MAEGPFYRMCMKFNVQFNVKRIDTGSIRVARFLRPEGYGTGQFSYCKWGLLA